MSVYEPTELEEAIMCRVMMGQPPVGPLTLAQVEEEEAYTRYYEEMEREQEAQDAAGGRTICPECGHRSVTHRGVVTLGYRGHPGAEESTLYKCEREGCDYAEL